MTVPEHIATWRDARYDMPVSRQLERYNELAAKHASARARIELVDRGIYDPVRHGADDRPPLTVAEHIELLALAECIARTVRHPANVHHALLAGVTWADTYRHRPHRRLRRAHRPVGLPAVGRRPA
ncbi:hypothetical protein ACIBF6_16560 [Streptosporangium amethystogenes]|uniref:hypothetical protein n=1 Tax=Streptosporangium amethystogenes TaxID=2002 RepID=UPI003798001C